MIGMSSFTRAEEIIKALQLDPTANLKRMSKGMKQKTALVAAFMNDPDILLLDEPTTGLDPLMRTSFIKLLNDEKKRGKTVFFSSHMFEELEDTCDYVGLIKDGHLLQVVDMNELKNNDDRYYKIGFENEDAMEKFVYPKGRIAFRYKKDKYLVIVIKKEDVSKFLKVIKDIPITYFKPLAYTLQNRFEELIVDKKEISV